MRHPISPEALLQRSADDHRRARRRAIALLLLPVDMLLLVSAAVAASYIQFAILDHLPFSLREIPRNYLVMTSVMTLVWPVFLYSEHLYDSNQLYRGSGELTRVLRALSTGVVALILIAFVFRLPYLTRGWIILLWVLAIAFVGSGRLAVRRIIERFRREGIWTKPTLIVGSNEEAIHILRLLDGPRSSGLVPIGLLLSSGRGDAARVEAEGVPILGKAKDLRHVVEKYAVSAVIIAGSAFSHEALARMIAELRNMPIDIHISSGLFEVLTRRVLVREIGGVPLISVRSVFFTRFNMARKRIFDVALSSIVLLAGTPLWLLIVLLIKLDSPGPVFYTQGRVGKNGKPFGMYKFRSMVDDAEARLAQLTEDNEADGPLFKMRYDPRVTRVGRWLRKYSLDEFPQLINVLRGEMSLVGPRPPLLTEAEKYSEYHWRRMEVLPGLTGIWQISGRSDISFEEMVRLDVYYIENWSVSFDIAILVRTVPAVVFARGAY